MGSPMSIKVALLLTLKIARAISSLVTLVIFLSLAPFAIAYAIVLGRAVAKAIREYQASK